MTLFILGRHPLWDHSRQWDEIMRNIYKEMGFNCRALVKFCKFISSYLRDKMFQLELSRDRTQNTTRRRSRTTVCDVLEEEVERRATSTKRHTTG